tara:strand:- start:288 stop:635 length:348 start_codon:yes stop_codon:yes gene_type:complete
MKFAEDERDGSEVSVYPSVIIRSKRKHPGETAGHYTREFTVSLFGAVEDSMICIEDTTKEYGHDNDGNVVEITPDHRDSLRLTLMEFAAIIDASRTISGLVTSDCGCEFCTEEDA